MKTTIFGILLVVTPGQGTLLCRLMRKYEFMLPNRQCDSLSDGVPGNNICWAKRCCHCDRTKLPCRRAQDLV